MNQPRVGPSSLATKEECPHDKAGPKTHMCPDCNGTMRRCCDSVVGTRHTSACLTWQEYMKMRAAMLGVVPEQVVE